MKTIERQIIQKQDELITELTIEALSIRSSEDEKRLRRELATLKSELSEPEKESGGKLNKTAEEIFKDICKQCNIRNVSDRFKSIMILAMEDYASQFQEQPITDEINEKTLISLIRFAQEGHIYTRGDYGLKAYVFENGIDKDLLQAFKKRYPKCKWIKSLKQKAQPGDEEIEAYVISKYPIIELEDKEGNKMDANSYFRECLIRELKVMRDGLIPAKDKLKL
jgi:hypothetical protein